MSLCKSIQSLDLVTDDTLHLHLLDTDTSTAGDPALRHVGLCYLTRCKTIAQVILLLLGKSNGGVFPLGTLETASSGDGIMSVARFSEAYALFDGLTSLEGQQPEG